MVCLHHFHLNCQSLTDHFDSRSFHRNHINRYMEDHSLGNYNFHLGMLTFYSCKKSTVELRLVLVQPHGTIDCFPSATLQPKPSGEGISKSASSDFFTMAVTKETLLQ